MAPDMSHDPWPGVQSKFYGGEGQRKVLEVGWSAGGGRAHTERALLQGIVFQHKGIIIDQNF